MSDPLALESELVPFAVHDERIWIQSETVSPADKERLLAELRRRLTVWRANLKPTREQLLQVTHEENRIHARLEGGNQQFWDGLDADWRRKQKPTNWEPKQEWSPKAKEWLEMERCAGRVFNSEKEAGDAYVASQRPPFAAPSEAQVSRDRILQVRMVGLRPDPDDVEKVLRDDLKYRQTLAEKLQKVKSEFLSERPQEPKPDPKRSPKGFGADGRSGTSQRSRPTEQGRPDASPLERAPHQKKPGNSIGWLAVGFAFLERGLDVIGYHSLFVGGGLFLAAFICFCVWFIRTEKARRWHIGVRAVIVCIAASIYFPVFGYQLYQQYRAESVSSPTITTRAPNVTAQPTIKSADEGKMFVDVDATYFATLYRKYNSVQADQAAQSYIGKWIRVTGIANDVVRDTHLNGPDFIRMTITIPTTDNLKMYVVLANFDQPRWMDRARIFGRGENVTVIGKIDHATDMGLILNECEIVE